MTILMCHTYKTDNYYGTKYFYITKRSVSADLQSLLIHTAQL